jgi:peptide/nickel transport system substrate-binding protein
MGGVRAVALAALSAWTFATAECAAQSQGLTMAVGAPDTSLDPHHHHLSPNNAISRHSGSRPRMSA